MRVSSIDCECIRLGVSKSCFIDASILNLDTDSHFLRRIVLPVGETMSTSQYPGKILKERPINAHGESQSSSSQQDTRTKRTLLELRAET